MTEDYKTTAPPPAPSASTSTPGAKTAEPAPKNEPQCWNCLHFIYQNQTSGVGLCRRHAPTSTGQTGLWPLALNTDWCGEYKAMVMADPQAVEKRRPRQDADAT